MEYKDDGQNHPEQKRNHWVRHNTCLHGSSKSTRQSSPHPLLLVEPLRGRMEKQIKTWWLWGADAPATPRTRHGISRSRGGPWVEDAIACNSSTFIACRSATRSRGTRSRGDIHTSTWRAHTSHRDGPNGGTSSSGARGSPTSSREATRRGANCSNRRGTTSHGPNGGSAGGSG